MPRIVLSYRRADSSAISGRIFDRLVRHYGAGRVFMDIDEIPFGIDFRDHIAEVLSTCDAVVAVMGRQWTGSEGAPHRIEDATDPVRVEVQTALERGVPVIPVLVEGAVMPDPAALPEPLRPLAYRNACEVASGRDFHAHVDRLIRSMDRMFPAGGQDADATAAASAGLAATGLAVVDRPTPGRPDAIAATRPAGTSPAPLTPLRTALLVVFLALPQLVQFSQRTPLFVAALLVSVVGTAAVLDRDDQPVTMRALTVAGILFAATVTQAALGIMRASFLDW